MRGVSVGEIVKKGSVNEPPDTMYVVNGASSDGGGDSGGDGGGRGNCG
jgi:hypothetical protein